MPDKGGNPFASPNLVPKGLPHLSKSLWMVFDNPKCSSLLIKHQTRELNDCCNINLEMCRFEKQVITQNHTPTRWGAALSPGTRRVPLCRPNRPLKWLWKSSIFPNFHRLEKYKIYLCFSGGGDLSIPHVFGLIGSPQSDPMGYLRIPLPSIWAGGRQ